MSLYGDYIKEHRDDGIIEGPNGFATYRFLPDGIYLVDLYVRPEFRKTGLALEMANDVVKIGIRAARNKLIGTVVPNAQNSAESMRLLLSYGMKPSHIDGNMVVFTKEI